MRNKFIVFLISALIGGLSYAGLEDLTGTKYIDALVSSNPVGGTDTVSTLDDHIRGIKNVVKLSFPNVTGAVTSTHTELNVTDAGATVTTPTVAGADAFLMDDSDVGVVQVDIDNVDTYLAATTKTLTNKTLTLPIISSISNTGTLTLPTATDTLVGRTTTDTLTNKTLTTPVLTLNQSATPTPTAEGDIQWDTDGNNFAVGDGAGTKVFSDDSVVQARANHTGTQLLSTISDVTSTATELNKLDGVPAGLTATELGYVDGVTSAIQTQIDGKIANDAGLTSIAGLTTAADKMIYTTASDTYATADLTSAGRALLDDANAAAQRTTLGAAASGANSDITSLTGLTTDLSEAQGGTGVSGMPSFHAQLGSNQTVTNNSAELIEFTSEVTDSHGYYDPTLGTAAFTPLVAGQYLVVIRVHFLATGLADGSRVDIALRKNGVAVKTKRQNTSSTTPQGFEMVSLIELNGTTDYISGQILTITGSDTTISGGSNTEFSAHWVGN